METDHNGDPYSVKYNGTLYYYITNLQGDVVRIVNASGASIGVYKYDAWGNILYQTDAALINKNPLRYRGYIYDTDTGFYYLQSRYYDPKIGRFLNADSYASTGQEFIGYNMYAYCNNSPVNMSDDGGNIPVEADGTWSHKPGPYASRRIDAANPSVFSWVASSAPSDLTYLIEVDLYGRCFDPMNQHIKYTSPIIYLAISE